MGPGTRCFQYQWVPTANLWVLNTIFNDKSAILLRPGTRPGLAEIKTYAQKMQDAQVTKSLKMWGLLSILSLFRNEFNKFNNTGAQNLM